MSAALRRVRGGETIEVTHHGIAVAVISPVPASPIEHLVAAGEVTRGGPPHLPACRFPVEGEMSASDALERDRAER